MRPFLPPLLAGALASGDLGLDFDGTSYSFLEAPPFLAGIFALAVLWYGLERRRAMRRDTAATADAPGIGTRRGEASEPGALALAVLAGLLGALLFAGSLASGDERGWPGLPAGAALALLGAVATGGLLGRVARRLDPAAAALLPVWADAAALVLAGLAILFPPLALIGLVVLAYLLVVGRRADEAKYQGLRILR